MTGLTLQRVDIEPGMRRLELTAPDELTLAGVLEVLVRHGAWFEPPVQFEDGGFGVVVWQNTRMPGYSFLVEAAEAARAGSHKRHAAADRQPGDQIASRLDRPKRR